MNSKKAWNPPLHLAIVFELGLATRGDDERRQTDDADREQSDRDEGLDDGETRCDSPESELTLHC